MHLSMSREYLRVKVTSELDADALAKLPVVMAITEDDARPVDADWKAAEWDQGRVRRLVGPLVTGRYSVWVRVTATPEVPVMRAGTLLVHW